MSLKNDYFQTFCKVSKALGSTRDREALLDLIVQSVLETLGGKAVCLWLVDPESHEFLAVAQKGLSKKYFQKTLRSQKIIPTLSKEGFLYAKDAATDPRLEDHEGKKAEGIASLLIVPVRVKDEIIGVLSLYTDSRRDFSEEEIDFLRALADQGGMAVENARLLNQIRKNTKLFHDLSASMNAALDLKHIFQTLTADLAAAIGVKAASVLLMDKEKQKLELVASHGLSDQYLNRGPLSVEKSMAETLKGKPVFIQNAQTDQRVQFREEKIREGIASILSVPIMARGEVIGALRLYTATPRHFAEDEILLATALAHQGGLAILNTSCYISLEKDMKDLKADLWSHRSWF